MFGYSSDFALNIYQPVIDVDPASSMSIDVTGDIDGWQRSIRGMGGYWQGNFSLTGSVGDLTSFFYQNLGKHVEERAAGQITWEGMIYEMELTFPFGVKRIRSLDRMFNHVRAAYGQGNDSVFTDAALTQASIDRYGRREEILMLDSYPQTAAEQYRNMFLKNYQYPRPRAVGVQRDTNVPVLEVNCCGYIFTANWRFESVGDGSMDDLSDWIEEIIDTDCADFLSKGVITANTTQVEKTNQSPQRAWDTIESLVEMGDSSNDFYRFYVGNQRIVSYVKVDTLPQYFVHEGFITDRTGKPEHVNPWQVKPSIVRDLDYMAQTFEYDDWLEDTRDFYADQITCGTGSGLSIGTSEYPELEIMATRKEYEYRLQQQKEKDKGSKKKKSRKDLPWNQALDEDMTFPTPREWERMSPKERNEARARYKKAKAAGWKKFG